MSINARLGEGRAVGLEARGFGEFPAGAEDEFIVAEDWLAAFGQFGFAFRGRNGSAGFGQSVGRLDFGARTAGLFRRVEDWPGTKLTGCFCKEGGRGEIEAETPGEFRS